MTGDNTDSPLQDDYWNPDGTPKPLFQPDELDIYVNKLTLEAYVFHGKPVPYESLERLEYNPADYSVTVVYKDGHHQDLGVKIQWLVRPYLARATEIGIVQTKDGQSVNGVIIPLINLGKKPEET